MGNYIITLAHFGNTAICIGILATSRSCVPLSGCILYQRFILNKSKYQNVSIYYHLSLIKLFY